MKNQQSVKENKSLKTQEQSLNNENKIVITTKFTNDEVKVKKPYKEPFIGKVFNVMVKSIVVITLPFIALKANAYLDNNYNPNNRIFNQDKVKYTLKYFGGDERYVDLKEDKLIGNNLITHLKVKENEPIKVGLDKNLTDYQRRACLDALDYFNKLFKIINPKYTFKVSDKYNKSNSTIYITHEFLQQEHYIAAAQPQNSMFALSNIKNGTIIFNTTYESKSYIGWKNTFLHEMMHMLLGAKDLDFTKSKTFSVMNYDDGGKIEKILTQLSNAEKSKGVKNDKYEKFTSLMPIDIVALISVYGDMKYDSNIDRYAKLIQNTLDNCISIFGHEKAYLNEDNSINYHYETGYNLEK